MLSYPTDLSPQEREIAQTRLRELTEEFTADETLTSPQWREAFERTWRHPYVPSYYPDIRGPSLLCIDPQRRGEWLEAVYSNETLITKIVHVPSSPTLRPATYPMYTSSSTAPRLMLTMLEALAVADGHRVLEIGTGTGYNAALLCERLGSENVTSVDIDPELVELARERLAANGYKPTLATVDGADGYPAGGPYDRIIATCAVPAIPTAWLEQVTPGGAVLADVHGAIGGTLARLTVNADQSATGRFLPRFAGFMWLRHTPELTQPEQLGWLDDEPTESTTEIDPALLHTDGRFGFTAQWHLPGVTVGPAFDDDGQPSTHLSAPDGSRAVVANHPTGGTRKVAQFGPRRLWDRLEEAHQFWQHAGQPNYDRFGITASPAGQHVWYDHPDSEHRWELLNPAAGTR